MMDERDVIEIVRRELDDWKAAQPAVCEYVQMMPIFEFAARDDDGRPLRVMGVALRDDGVPEWVVGRVGSDGALEPVITPAVWDDGS